MPEYELTIVKANEVSINLTHHVRIERLADITNGEATFRILLKHGVEVLDVFVFIKSDPLWRTMKSRFGLKDSDLP